MNTSSDVALHLAQKIFERMDERAKTALRDACVVWGGANQAARDGLLVAADAFHRASSTLSRRSAIDTKISGGDTDSVKIELFLVGSRVLFAVAHSSLTTGGVIDTSVLRAILDCVGCNPDSIDAALSLVVSRYNVWDAAIDECALIEARPERLDDVSIVVDSRPLIPNVDTWERPARWVQVANVSITLEHDEVLSFQAALDDLIAFRDSIDQTISTMKKLETLHV